MNKYALFPLACLAGAVLQAAPVSEATAVHLRPDTAAPIIFSLKPGTEPVAVADPAGPTPAGWMAVKINGPFLAYVASADVTKGLDAKVGAELRLFPRASAPAFAKLAAGDKAEIRDLRGAFAEVNVEKEMIGYVLTHVAMPVPAVPAAAVPVAAAPNAPAAAPSAGTEDLPRLFQGVIVSTRRPLAPRRPYDYQINDASGARLAYLDLSKVMPTEQLANFVNRTVVVQGVGRNDPELRAIVLQVESLQLR